MVRSNNYKVGTTRICNKKVTTITNGKKVPNSYI